jgi:hypothetical protein
MCVDDARRLVALKAATRPSIRMSLLRSPLPRAERDVPPLRMQGPRNFLPFGFAAPRISALSSPRRAHRRSVAGEVESAAA